MKSIRFVVTFLLLCISCTLFAKQVRIRITGTIRETVTMHVGDATYKINSTPFEFYIEKKELPKWATFESENYVYDDIMIHWNDPDPFARGFFVLRSEKKDFAQKQSNDGGASQPQVAVANVPKGPVLDAAVDVNQVPVTNNTNANTFALIIANENYEMAANVDMAGNDGLAFKEYCSKTLGLGNNNIKYYPDASYGRINKAINEIKSIAAAFDGDINLIVYYAGHGIPDNATQDAFLMPVDADGTDQSVCLSLKSLYKSIDDMKVNQAVVFLDACFSGAKRDGDMIVAARGVAIKPKAAKPAGKTIIFSATSNEEAAYSYKEKQHGMFSYFLLHKLKETNGKATLGDLAEYITTQVRRQSIVINGKSQTPNVFVPELMGEEWKTRKLTGK